MDNPIEKLANELYNLQDKYNMSNPFEVAKAVLSLGYTKIDYNNLDIISSMTFNGKEKQMMELLKDKEFVKLVSLIDNTHPFSVETIALRVYEKYQPKLPEGSIVLTEEELNYKNHETNYWKERAEMAKTAMFTLRQDTTNEIVELLNENGNKELANLVKEEFSVKARKYTINSLIDQARKQAVKEFAERLKKERQLIDLGCGDGCYEYIDIDDIDYIAIDEFGVEL